MLDKIPPYVGDLLLYALAVGALVFIFKKVYSRAVEEHKKNRHNLR